MWINGFKGLLNPNQNRVVDSGSPMVGWLNNQGQQSPLVLVWWCLTLCIISSALVRFEWVSSGFLFYVLIYTGSAGCAWFWLLSRCLFTKQPGIRPWSVVVVAMVMLIEGTADWILHATTSGGGEVARVVANAASMICIAAIVFVFHEALAGYQKIKSEQERRFRLWFIVGFGLMTGVAVLWVMGAYSGSMAARWNAELLTLCSLIGVVGSRMAIQYRMRHPLIHTRSLQQGAHNEAQLARRIQQAISDEALLTRIDLKVAAFAEHLDEQEYKVTRCITNHLAYRNFNHLLNHHRIERAKKLLNDPGHSHKTIATIAFDCGYNSLGPFNRAFKAMTGSTPREFRKSVSQ
jgi:AraC-like DNA-binding protein